jgi:hypothetical protein
VSIETLVSPLGNQPSRYLVSVEDTHFKKRAKTDEDILKKSPHMEIFENKDQAFERFNELEFDYGMHG